MRTFVTVGFIAAWATTAIVANAYRASEWELGAVKVRLEAANARADEACAPATKWQLQKCVSKSDDRGRVLSVNCSFN